MIIDNSSINLSAQHLVSRQQQQQQSLQLFQVDQQGNLQASVELSREQLQQSVEAMAVRVNHQDPKLTDTVLKAELAQQRPDAASSTSELPLNPRQPITGVGSTAQAAEVDAAPSTLDPRTQLIKSILERMLGKEIKIGNSGEPSTERSAQSQTASEQPTEPAADSDSGPLELGMRYQSQRSIDEFEQTSFQAQGKVRTRDGREIDFALSMTMSRHFSEQSSLLIEAGATLKDPLVINFDGRAAELHNNRFAFDLDADGELDQIHQLASHSGMLALDKNGDGIINDGRELFGAISGNGFTDLAQYDQDGNGFIDEADTVFDQLNVWIKDEQGNDQLLGLKELGVGALYLGAADTPFDLKGSDNELQGKIRATGVYLSESGATGTLQQLDLVV